jgi:cobalt-zinc-cadmium efflux system membrane fusion protein
MGAGARIAGIVAAIVIIAVGAYALIFPLPWRQTSSEPPKASAAETTAPAHRPTGANALTASSVTLGDQEMKTVKVQAVSARQFTVARDAVGKIAFNEDASVPVFTPYQGRITQLFVKPGDQVKKGQVLFEIDSPDLVNAESTLITAVGTLQQTKGQLDLTTRALNRAKELIDAQAIARKDLDQATADHNAADATHKAAVGALNGARDAVRIFGKTDAEIRRIEETRRIDSKMPVPSPIDAKVTVRKAGPGQYVQPGGDPVYTIANVSSVWMSAKVAEADIPLIRLGQEADVKVMAYPGRRFHGKITYIAASVDPDTHRVLVRTELPDPDHALLPEMFATFLIRTGQEFTSPAVPYGGVVREGDGSMSVWVTEDHHRFDKRTVRVGLQQGGYDQILDGLKSGEFVATDGALFLNNALTAESR